MNITKKGLSLLLLIFLSVTSYSQVEIKYGVKAGLSFSDIKGDREKDAQGVDLEKTNLVTRFHAGLVFSMDLIKDKLSVAPEFMFVQRGAKYEYNGPGAFAFNTNNSDKRTIQGIEKEVRAVSNSYISIPVLFHYKPIKYVKIGAGLNFDFLVSSTATGETTLSWKDSRGEAQKAVLIMDLNYYTDKVGEASAEMIAMEIDGGNKISHPQVLGAYYSHTKDEGNLYKVFDMGLNADLTVALSRGIGLGFRLNYGLLDITNDKMDLSQNDLSTTRADKDSNITYQVSLGFNF